MANDTQQIVAKAWNFAGALRDDGLSYLSYTEQITFLLFLKIADELSSPPHNRPALVPEGYDWKSLLALDGEELLNHYRHILETLQGKPGMLGDVFRRAKSEIQNPAILRRLVVELIDPVKWTSMRADVKGDIYEGLLDRTMTEVAGGAGQYFTPRALISAIVDVMRPSADDTVCDPACGTGGFLWMAHAWVVHHHGADLDPDQKKHLRSGFVRGTDIVPNTARLCIMNLLLHGIIDENADPCPIRSGVDSLASHGGDHFSLVLTNPPFGKKSTIAIVNEEGELERSDAAYERPDFWTSTKNKQLNFLQHCRTLLTTSGRCAIVVPDNVLFEGGAGETVRRNLLQQCDVHTLLRLPTGIFYAQGVKANVLFFDNRPGREQPWTDKLWVYDLRTNMHFTLKQNPLTRGDLDEFAECFNPANRHERRETWSQDNPDGRWRCFDYEELVKRDKLNLDILWLRDESLEESDSLPEPDIIAQEIADDLEAALDQFQQIVNGLVSTLPL